MISYKGEMSAPKHNHGDRIQIGSGVGTIHHRSYDQGRWRYGVITDRKPGHLCWVSEEEVKIMKRFKTKVTFQEAKFCSPGDGRFSKIYLVKGWRTATGQGLKEALHACNMMIADGYVMAELTESEISALWTTDGFSLPDREQALEEAEEVDDFVGSKYFALSEEQKHYFNVCEQAFRQLNDVARSIFTEKHCPSVCAS